MADRFFTTIFCDDMRFEMGGKRSLMGIYSAQLIVPSIPVVLPKLCVVAIVHTPLDRPFQKLLMRILMDGDVIAEMAVDPATLEDIRAGAKKREEEPPSGDNRMIVAHIAANIAPFPIEKEFRLRVRVHTEDEELVGPALEIKAAASPPAQSLDIPVRAAAT